MMQDQTPMTCRECRETLPDFAARTGSLRANSSEQARDLSPALRRRINAHLATCPRCDARYRAYREVARELRSTLPAVGTTDTMRLNRVWTTIQQEIARPRRAPQHPRRMSAASALLVVALVLTLSLSANQLARALPTPPTPTTPAATEETETARTESKDAAEIAMVILSAEGEETAPALEPERSQTPAAPLSGDALTVTPPGAPRYAPTAQTEQTPTESPDS